MIDEQRNERVHCAQTVKKVRNRQNRFTIQRFFTLWISFTKVWDSKLYSMIPSLLCKDFDLLRNSRPTVPMYADERELLVFRTFLQSVSVPKRVFRHAEAGGLPMQSTGLCYFCAFLHCAAQVSQQPLHPPQQPCFLWCRSAKINHAATSASSAMSSQFMPYLRKEAAHGTVLPRHTMRRGTGTPRPVRRGNVRPVRARWPRWPRRRACRAG